MANNKGLMGLLLQGLAANKSNGDEIPVKDGGSRSVTIQGDLTSRTPAIEGINPETGVAPLGAEYTTVPKGYEEGVDYNILDLVHMLGDKRHFSGVIPETVRLIEEGDAFQGDKGYLEGDVLYKSLSDLMNQHAKGNRDRAHRIEFQQKALRQMLESALGEKVFEEYGGDYDIGTEIGQRLAKLKELGR